ncbi:MAG: hypothetical protein NUW37_03645 [Planctomycetes bacterium]|nr:hypothetical protein [Planctomycetota bacterium]
MNKISIAFTALMFAVLSAESFASEEFDLSARMKLRDSKSASALDLMASFSLDSFLVPDDDAAGNEIEEPSAEETEAGEPQDEETSSNEEEDSRRDIITVYRDRDFEMKPRDRDRRYREKPTGFKFWDYEDWHGGGGFSIGWLRTPLPHVSSKYSNNFLFTSGGGYGYIFRHFRIGGFGFTAADEDGDFRSEFSGGAFRADAVLRPGERFEIDLGAFIGGFGYELTEEISKTNDLNDSRNVRRIEGGGTLFGAMMNFEFRVFPFFKIGVQAGWLGMRVEGAMTGNTVVAVSLQFGG